jgi:protein-disulfide isomerase
VQLVEFADFRCGYCARLQPVLAGLLEEYPEQVRLAFVHMPVVSRDSGPAAVAAEAARRQGAFWGMHDALFALQGAPLREADVRIAALELGLDVERFAADLRDPLLLDRVRADLAHVRRLGIDGTPALLVNGRLYVGLLSRDELQRLVEAALAAAR